MDTQNKTQREIKFRVKLSDGRWMFGESGRRHTLVNADKKTEHVTLALFWEIVLAQKVVAESLGEYTGLKDKNGKEIYEGDMVKCIGQFIDYETFEVVQYYGGAWGLEGGEEYLRDLISTRALRYASDGGEPIYTEIEVIGDIYENK